MLESGIDHIHHLVIITVCRYHDHCQYQGIVDTPPYEYRFFLQTVSHTDPSFFCRMAPAGWGVYPLTAPATTPSMMYFWQTRYRMTTGNTVSMMQAIMGPISTLP